MDFLLNGFKVPLAKAGQPLSGLVAKELGLSVEAVTRLTILRESVDARKNKNLAFVYSLKLELTVSQRQFQRLIKAKPNLQKYTPQPARTLVHGDKTLVTRPVVIGAGPAGYFAALTLAKQGYAPILLERGDDVDTRRRLVEGFWQGGSLDTESNVQFGEGGAGTFSDGKLTTRTNDPRIAFVLETFVQNGAPSEILYKHKPHVGTDKLRDVVKGMRRQLIAFGGEVRFRAKVTGIKTEGSAVAGVEINGAEEIPAQAIILAIGHSARDTYIMLNEMDVAMEAKAFAIGLRVEHPQDMIDRIQFGEEAGNPHLGAADYQLAYQDSVTGRAAYAFCMCPGGSVVAATSEKGQVVTNGMSEFARATGTANSALVVTVKPNDFSTPLPLGGIEFQRKWEKAAFKLGGNNYHAPAQTVQDFIMDRTSSKLELDATYLPGVELANLREVLPKEVGEALGRALGDFNRKITGFASAAATLTGVETRTSAPVRILRDENLQSLNVHGLYPAGEGAGYAGGIVSAAVDGIKAAETIISQYRPLERGK